MIRKCSIAAAVAIVAALSCPLVGQAEILTFVMEGTVSIVGSDPPGLPNYAQLGDRARYTFTFDSNAPNASSYPWLGGYEGISASLQVGNAVLPCTAPSILISHPNDILRLDSAVSPPPVDFLRGNTYFRLLDQVENNALEDHQLPLEPYELEPFSQREFMVYLVMPASPPEVYERVVSFGGQIDAFYAVPEPCGALTLVSTLVIIVDRRQRLH